MIDKIKFFIKNLNIFINSDRDDDCHEHHHHDKDFMLKVCKWVHGKLVTKKYYFDDFEDCIKKYNKIDDCVKMYNRRGQMIRTKNCTEYEQVYC